MSNRCTSRPRPAWCPASCRRCQKCQSQSHSRRNRPLPPTKEQIFFLLVLTLENLRKYLKFITLRNPKQTLFKLPYRGVKCLFRFKRLLTYNILWKPIDVSLIFCSVKKTKKNPVKTVKSSHLQCTSPRIVGLDRPVDRSVRVEILLLVRHVRKRGRSVRILCVSFWRLVGLVVGKSIVGFRGNQAGVLRHDRFCLDFDT